MYCLFVFIFQFKSLSNENFPQIDGKYSVHKNMNRKINTNRRYILNLANTVDVKKRQSGPDGVVSLDLRSVLSNSNNWLGGLG